MNSKTKIFFINIILIIAVANFAAITAQNKTAQAVRVQTAPKLDGFLNDDVWSKAILINDFTQREPTSGVKPSFQTDVRIIYDDENLYIGVMCYDNEPEKLIARELKWDGRISADDNIKILFDTFNDNRSAYWFGINSLGAQNDALLTGFEFRDFNQDWDAVWEVETQILDNGWSAELRFPFSSFKFYDKEEQVWGFNIQRDIRRLNEETLWTSYGQNQGLLKIAEAGDLVGLKNIKRGSPVYLMPYFIAGAHLKNGDKTYVHEPGLDIKYGIGETLSLDVTINTDFAQVEADRARINLTRFPLFFPEKRDFFLEGMKTFDFPLGFRNQLFYSRRIGISGGKEIPIIAGAKLVGRVGNFEVGAINMQAAETAEVQTTNFSTTRVKYDLFNQSYIGFLLTNKMHADGYNRAFGGDLNFSFNNFLSDKNLVIRASVAKSDQKNNAKNSWGGNFFIDYPNDLIDMFAGYRFLQSNFNPEMGFLSRKGVQEITYRFQLSPRVNWDGIRKLNFDIMETNMVYDKNGILQTASWGISPFGISTDAGDNISFQINRSFDRLISEFNIFENQTIKMGTYWFTSFQVEARTSQSRDIAIGLNLSTGNFYNGTKTSFSTNYSLTVGQHFTFLGDYSYNSISIEKNNFTTSEIGGRISYDFSTRLASSVFAQWNNEADQVNMNYRLNWKPKIGSDFYLVINQVLSTENKIKSKDFAVLAKAVWMIII